MIEYDAGSGESAEIRRIVRRSVRLTQLVLVVVLGAFLYSKRTELGFWGIVRTLAVLIPAIAVGFCLGRHRAEIIARCCIDKKKRRRKESSHVVPPYGEDSLARVLSQPSERSET